MIIAIRTRRRARRARAGPHLILLRHDRRHESTEPAHSATDGASDLWLLFRYQDLELPALRQVGREEVLEERVREDAHPKRAEAEVRPVRVLAHDGGRSAMGPARLARRRPGLAGRGRRLHIRLRALRVLEEVLHEVRNASEVSVSRLQWIEVQYTEAEVAGGAKSSAPRFGRYTVKETQRPP